MSAAPRIRALTAGPLLCIDSIVGRSQHDDLGLMEMVQCSRTRRVAVFVQRSYCDGLFPDEYSKSSDLFPPRILSVISGKLCALS